MKSKSIFISLVLVFFVSSIQAQDSAKDHYRNGVKEFKKAMYPESIASFTKAIQLDQSLTDAFFNRALAYQETDQLEKAIEDYNAVNKLDIENKDAWLNNGELNFKLKKYAIAAEKFSHYLNLEKKDLAIYNKIISAYYAVQDWQSALKYAKLSLEVKDLKETYYMIGDIEFVLKNFQQAESAFRSVLAEDPEHLNARLYLAQTLYEQGRYDDAIAEANMALSAINYNKKAFYARVNSFHKKQNYPQAIADLSTMIAQGKDDSDFLDLLNFRADLYMEYNQPMLAIADYSYVINQNPQHIYARYHRAKAYEAITKKDAAILDYTEIINLSNSIDVDKQSLNDSKTSLIDLKREKNNPFISVIDYQYADGLLFVPLNKNEIELKLNISDENPIKEVSIEGGGSVTQLPTKEEALSKWFPIISNEYLAKLDISDLDEFIITAEDVYGNKESKTIRLKRIEKNTPDIVFTAPIMVDGAVALSATDTSSIKIEGRIKDESLIASFSINNAEISIDKEDKNPVFSTELNIKNLNKLSIEIKDINNNRLSRDYPLVYDTMDKNKKKLGLNQVVKSAALPIVMPVVVPVPKAVEQEKDTVEEAAAEEPILGENWIVFIENSDYAHFEKDNSASAEIRMMQSALSNYKVDKIIHKQNLTKDQMDRFFSIELRDLINSNRVNALVVWYAGQGLYLNDVGYWIPVNAELGDEFGYYNTNNLKTSMQLYANRIRHTLIVSNACISGPTFHQPMDLYLEMKKCTDHTALKNRSAQLFFAERSTVDSDQSIFTETFANTLIYNTEQCISMEAIVSKVTETLVNANQKKPQFAKISDFSDENGTFFFFKD
ncbi:MAG: tetratricopeptide repeat protein [Bacteroidales bacterium]|nr:tetratricopeptide repeat protein [Bacteroidales bacterium]